MTEEKNGRYVAGQIMIMFKAGITEEQATEIIEVRGWRKINWISNLNIMLAAVPVGREAECVREIANDDSVKTAMLNRMFKVTG